jgi:hypothetical protein
LGFCLFVLCSAGIRPRVLHMTGKYSIIAISPAPEMHFHIVGRDNILPILNWLSFAHSARKLPLSVKNATNKNGLISSNDI